MYVYIYVYTIIYIFVHRHNIGIILANRIVDHSVAAWMMKIIVAVDTTGYTEKERDADPTKHCCCHDVVDFFENTIYFMIQARLICTYVCSDRG